MTGRSPTIVHTLFMLQMKHNMNSEVDMTLVLVVYVSIVIVMHYYHDSNCDGWNTCLISETPTPTHVYLGFRNYSSTVQSRDHSLAHPTEKLSLWFIFNRLWNSYVVLNWKCVFILIKPVISNHFISRFQSFLERQNMKQTVHNS